MKRKSIAGNEKSHLGVIAGLLSFGNDHAIEAKIASGLKTATEERGYKYLNGIVPIDPRTEVRRLVRDLDGQILGIAIQPYRPNKELAELLLTPPVKDIPHILIGHYYANLNISACVIDNYGGMYAITERLVQSGRRQLAFFGEVSLSSTEHERFLGFAEACLHNGLRIKPEHIINSYNQSDVKQTIQSLYSGPNPPDGIVCLFDGIAEVGLRILKEAGIRVPQDVAVVSFGDDMDIADKCDPPLSTACHPAYEMGAVAAHQLINQIEQKIPSTDSIYVLPVGLQPRESCGSLRPGESERKFMPVPFSGYIGTCTTLEEARTIGLKQD